MTTSLSSSAHTPGPWQYECTIDEPFNSDGVAYRVFADEERFVAEVFICRSDEEATANARLIAAAPDLLEYCKSLRADCHEMAEDHSVGANWDWSLTERNLDQVIAKAEGR